jgi:hypothetical protein
MAALGRKWALTPTGPACIPLTATTAVPILLNFRFHLKQISGSESGEIGETGLARMVRSTAPRPTGTPFRKVRQSTVHLVLASRSCRQAPFTRTDRFRWSIAGGTKPHASANRPAPSRRLTGYFR